MLYVINKITQGLGIMEGIWRLWEEHIQSMLVKTFFTLLIDQFQFFEFSEVQI